MRSKQKSVKSAQTKSLIQLFILLNKMLMIFIYFWLFAIIIGILSAVGELESKNWKSLTSERFICNFFKVNVDTN